MISYSRRLQVFAVASAATAGFVDAVAFIQSGGYFVSFMSGNSTRLGVETARGSPAALLALGLIGAFVIGVMAGSVIGRVATRRRPMWILLAVGALLAVSAAAATGDRLLVSSLVSAAAMGLLNAVVEENGQSRIGLTYMTGALAKVGQRAVDALFGGPRWGWTPYLLLWVGLAGGALAGALAFGAVGAVALWGAVVLTLGLALVELWKGAKA